MMMRMMTVMIRLMTVMITIIVASSALPMLPNATLAMYIVERSKKRMMMTAMMMIRMLTMRIRTMTVMITIIVAVSAFPMLAHKR